MAAPAVKLLGELGLRVNDLERMTAFYRDVIGLEPWREEPGYVFLRIAEGTEGHPQVLVLFDRGVEVSQAATTIDHFAFVIAREDHDSWHRHLEAAGLDVLAKEFPRFGWRALFVRDPEGNVVELVCHDPAVGSR